MKFFLNFSVEYLFVYIYIFCVYHFFFSCKFPWSLICEPKNISNFSINLYKMKVVSITHFIFKNWTCGIFQCVTYFKIWFCAIIVVCLYEHGCICVCICECVCVCICVSLVVCVWTWLSVHIYVSVVLFIFVWAWLCVRAWLCVWEWCVYICQ